MEIELKNEFKIVEEGTQYLIPEYRVVDGQSIVETGNHLPVNFVRGSKLKDEEVPRRDGTLHEHLLSVVIHDLKHKNKLVPSREGSLVITNLEQAMHWLIQRQIDRKQREVEGTYKS